MKSIISESLQSSSIEEYQEMEHVMIVDDNVVSNANDLETLIKKMYNMVIFDENSKVHLKLKINLREYLLIDDVLYPTYVKYL